MQRETRADGRFIFFEFGRRENQTDLFLFDLKVCRLLDLAPY